MDNNEEKKMIITTNSIHKKNIFILIVIFILGILMIGSSVYARYIIAKNSKITITSEPFYFDAQIASALKFDNTATLTLKNNDGTNWNESTATYKISLEGNSKFSFSINDVAAVNNTITDTIAGGSLIDESLNLKFIADVTQLNPTESATLKIACQEPYSKEISIPITISLHAVTVTLNANGGSVSPSSIVVYKGQSYSSLPTPAWPGHTFDGWFSAESGGTQYTTGTTVTTSSSTQTLYAHWTTHLLADLVKPGDYVAYDIDYDNVYTKAGTSNLATLTGWRVLSVEGSRR